MLQAAITSTPGSALGSGILILELREKKKPGSTLPNNFDFSSKGTITYVPKGNSLSRAHQLTRICLLADSLRAALQYNFQGAKRTLTTELILKVGIIISKTIMSLLLPFCNMAGLSIIQQINFLTQCFKIIPLLNRIPHYFMITLQKSSNTNLGDSPYTLAPSYSHLEVSKKEWEKLSKMQRVAQIALIDDCGAKEHENGPSSPIPSASKFLPHFDCSGLRMTMETWAKTDQILQKKTCQGGVNK